jgi:hypothetical protein
MNLRAALVTVTFVFLLNSAAIALSDAELDRIGRRVWQNECGGTRDGLTSWNSGESFASLGIGHFIWYPPGQEGPFEESFPKLAKFLAANGAKVPAWMHGDCPWTTRAEFMNDFRSARMNELRDLLAGTIRLQSRFLALRMREALPKMLAAAPVARRDYIQRRFDELAATGAGTFALIDYVNFKGEGIKASERYQGEGWGLLQVLSGMPGGEHLSPAARFARSAEEVLTRRVENSPPERKEKRWLPGWINRVRSYAD